MPDDNPAETAPLTSDKRETVEEEDARKRDDAIDRLWRVLVNSFAFVVLALLCALGVLVVIQRKQFYAPSTEQVPNLSTLFSFAQAWIFAVGFALTGLQIRLARRQNKATEEQIRLQREDAQRQFKLAQNQFKFAQDGSREAQVWKMREFITGEIRVFNDDPAVANVKRMLDGIAGGFEFETFILVNESGSAGPASLREKLVTPRDLLNALTPASQNTFEPLSGESSTPLKKYSKFESQIAGEFDRYFTYLISFDTFLATNAVTWDQLEPNLQYWLNLTFKEVTETRSDVEKVHAQLNDYIKEYYPYNFHLLKGKLKEMQIRRAGDFHSPGSA